MSHDYSAIYDPDTDFDRHFTRLTAQRIRRWFRPGDRVLELGCATGLMTSLMAQADVTIDAVERVPAYLERARARKLTNATFLDADVMQVDPPGPYNHVVAAHIVNELPDPVGFLRRFESFLAPGGLVHTTVTNPASVHRLVAIEMGLIERPDALSDRGQNLATKEIFDQAGFEALAARAGLLCIHREPVMLKPLTNAQLAELPDEVIDGLDRVAWRFPEHGGLNYSIFVVDA
jgi:trans-aconitate methyltransferase